MATLADVLRAIDATPATETTCVQGTCKIGDVWMTVSDGAPSTAGQYRYEVAMHVGNGPTMSQANDEATGVLLFFSLAAPRATIANSTAWEIETVRHYF